MVKIKKNKNLKTVCFDEEIITKDCANELLSKVEEDSAMKTADKFNAEIENVPVIKRRKDKRKKQNDHKLSIENEDKNQELVIEIKCKRKRRKLAMNADQNLNNQDNIENLNEDVIIEKQSKRKKKKAVDEIETSEQHEVNNEEKQSKRKKKKTVEIETSEHHEVNNEEKQSKRKKKKTNQIETSEQHEVNDEEGDAVSIENPKVKTNESIRAQKKRKHAKLLEEKRLKAELGSQQNVLNYLSKWKHCQSEWKFEKLKQIWLQQNLFDTSKIPNEFWETAVEYFNGSKGFIRKVVLRDALKIIEKEESTEEENTDENSLLILKRARDVVQHLQE